jgi:hypothetical protein
LEKLTKTKRKMIVKTDAKPSTVILPNASCISNASIKPKLTLHASTLNDVQDEAYTATVT